jgi:hypothetical protein
MASMSNRIELYNNICYRLNRINLFKLGKKTLRPRAEN